MKFAKEAAVVAVAGVVAGLGVGVVVDAPASAACAPIVLAVGGSGDPASTNLPGVHGSTPVPWPAPRIPTDESQVVGRQNLGAAIDRAYAGCPGRQVSVVGYSAGAQVAGDVCDARPNVRCTLIADPRRDGGFASHFPSLLPGYTNPPPRTVKPNEVQECAKHDWVCDYPRLITDPVGFVDATVGAFTGRHTDYYQGPQEQAAPPAQTIIPTAKTVLEPIVQAVVPDVPVGGEYRPTPWVKFLPPAIQPVLNLLPDPIKNWAPPPIG